MLRILFSIFVAAFLLSACKHDPEALPFIPSPPLPVDTIEIFSPCDTSQSGVAEAVKTSAAWVAAANCNPYIFDGKKYWGIKLNTCSITDDLREEIIFSDIPDNNAVHKYNLHPTNKPVTENFIRAFYTVLTEDGDVVESFYPLDSLAQGDYLEIHSWNKQTREVEGSFRVSFKKAHLTWAGQPVPDYSNNPEQVKFWKGRFRLRLPE